MEYTLGTLMTLAIMILTLISKNNGNTHTNHSSTDPGELSAEQIRQNRIRRMRERSRDYRLYRIRQEMLDAFDWESFPVIQDRRRILSRTNLTQFFMHTDLCYVAVCPSPNWVVPTSRQIMKVKFDVFQTNEEVQNASISLFLNQRRYCQCSADADQDRLNVKIYQLIPRPNRRRGSRRGRRRRLIHTQMITWVQGTWVTFPITRAARDWVRVGGRNLGLAVQVFDEFDTQINAHSVFYAGDCNRSPDIDCSEIKMLPLPIRPIDIVLSPTMKVTQISIPGRQRAKRDTTRKSTQSESRRTGRKLYIRNNGKSHLLSSLSTHKKKLLRKILISKFNTFRN